MAFIRPVKKRDATQFDPIFFHVSVIKESLLSYFKVSKKEGEMV